MKKIFLLGGYDLEMIEIRNLLEKNNQKYYDYKLKWGASLSAYQSLLNDKEHFIAVELDEDISQPRNFTLIDHHGENSYKPSSLEQIAKILNVSLNRWQQLVAINDVSYIPGLQEFGATQDEIVKIREADRLAQGISLSDEKIAQESIKVANPPHIIKTTIDHFSAITDSIYDKFTQYIIFNDIKIVFYGYEVKKVLYFLSLQNISNENYYYGGGTFGFVGIKDTVLSKEMIKKLIEEFKRYE